MYFCFPLGGTHTDYNIKISLSDYSVTHVCLCDGKTVIVWCWAYMMMTSSVDIRTRNSSTDSLLNFSSNLPECRADALAPYLDARLFGSAPRRHPSSSATPPPIRNG